MADMQSLSFDIAANSAQAVKGLDQLVTSLEKLKRASSGSVTSLKNVSSSIGSLASSMNTLNGANVNKITELGAALRSLKGATVSKTVATNLANLGTALKSISGVGEVATSFQQLATSLQSLKGTGSSLGTLFKRLAELPALIEALSKADLKNFTAQMKALSAALAPMSTQMATVGTGFSKLAYNADKAASAVKRTTASTAEYGTALGATLGSMGSFIGKLSMFALGFHVVKGVFDRAITLSNEYQENLNLFTVAMGTGTEAAYEYAQAVSEAVGIDPAEWMRNQGVFNTLIGGFGVAADRAEIMSKNLTQLGYDLSSFYNINTADALQKIQSGISGELEPLRRLGYDLSVTRLQQEALNLGITKSVNAMTQAEKAQLRYYAIMTQVTEAQGDMARTLESPANQLRILQAQVTMAARAFGNIFIPILNAVLPYLIAVAKMIRIVSAAIASLFGFKLTEIDYGSVTKGIGGAASAGNDLADANGRAGKAAKKAAKEQKKYNKQLLGFDRINNLTKPDDKNRGGAGGGGGGGGGVGGLGGGLDFDLPQYDFLAGLENYLDEKHPLIKKFGDWVAKHIKGVMSTLAAAVAGLIGVISWVKLAKFAKVMRGLFGSGWLKTAGTIFGTIAGAVLALLAAVDMLKNGITKGNVLQYLIGIGIVAGTIALAFTPMAGAIALVVGLLAGLVIAIKSLVLHRNEVIAYLDKKFPGAMKKIRKVLGPIIPYLKKFGDILEGLIRDPLRIKTIKSLWKKLSKFFKEKFSIKGLFGGKAKDSKDTSFFAAKIKDAFEGAFGKIDGAKLIKGAFEMWVKGLTFPLNIALNIADTALDGFNDLTGIDLKATFSGWAEGAKAKWDSFKEGFGDIVSTVIAAFGGWVAGAKDKWDSLRAGITDKVASAKMAYEGWVSGAKAKWDSLRDAIKDKTAHLTISITAGISSVYRKVQKQLAAAKKKAPKAVRALIPTLPALASGGMLNKGQMFIAREAGPEMVGKIGNKSAVANNAQIEGSIARSVAAANTSQNALLRQLINAVNNGNRSEGGTADIKLIIDGQTLGKAAIKNINKVQRQQGRTLLEV